MKKFNKINKFCKRLYALRAHHLGSLIFQAFRKKTPQSDQGSFHFAKSNHFKRLQNHDLPKNTIIADTFKKCDTYRKNSQLFLPKFHI